MSKHVGKTLLATVVFCVGTVLLVMFSSGLWFDNTQEVDNKTNIEIARELYQKIENTPLSQVNYNKYIDAIHERLNCYKEHYKYTERVNICMSNYQKQIISIAQETDDKRPMMGKFLMKLNECPVMFNMCRGKNKDVETCVVFEKQCVDFFLDHFWRGKWQKTLKGN